MLIERRSRDMASIERRGRNPSAQIMRGLLAELDRFYLRRDMSIESILAVKLAPMIDLLTDAMLMAHLTSMAHTITAAEQHTTGKAFGVFDSAIARFQRLAEMSPRQLATLRNKYQNASFVTVKGMSGDLEKKIQRSLLNTAKRELSGKAAIRVFRRSLAASGIDMRANVAEAVYRTQTAIAYGTGQREANSDPLVDEILWGYEYNTAGDDRVRPTHEAMDGRRAPKDHPMWDTWFPPAGWNCRCVCTEIFIDDPASMRRTKLPPEYIGPKDNRVRVVPDKGFATDFALPIR